MTKRPGSLQKGDKIGLIAPSRMIEESQVEQALNIFSEWGFEVVKGSSLFARHGYFAGTDDQRYHDLQGMLDDPAIRAIFCARGGYGMTRIVDQVDLTAMIDQPKWVVGFSDITALHLALNRKGIESIHGLMPVQYEYMGIEASLSSLKKILFDEGVDYELPSHPMNKTGEAAAAVIGGNLSLVAESLGTGSEINTDGKILFLEEIDEYLYKIDRMLMQLRRAGKLSALAGVIVGSFSHMKDTQIPFGKSILPLIADHLSDADIPIAYGFPVGHEPEHNLAIPCGRRLTLSVTKEQVRLTE